ncbi:MAG: PD-(D/E)XK nuclease family protein [Firmicutes bacterium]|nr:PD-(D/E)XK nuclease family protein [Candidatus Colimorpha enterica]
MNVKIITGGAGTGKTYRIAVDAAGSLKEGKRVVIIVPEHAALLTESVTAEICEKEGVDSSELEVLSFRRLANTVEKEYGNLSYNPAGKGIRQLAMWKAYMEASVGGGLKYYGQGESDLGVYRAGKIVPLLIQTVKELEDNGLTEKEAFGNIAPSTEDEKQAAEQLRKKIGDIFLLKSKYNNILRSGGYDTDNELEKLLAALKEHKYFRGRDVYIDGFAGFTKLEYRVLAEIMRTADVTVFAFTDDGSGRPMFGNVGKTVNAIMKSAKANAKRELLAENHRFGDGSALSFLEKNFAAFSPDTFGKDTDEVSLFVADTSYGEAEYIACDIKEKLRNDPTLRYRELAVICGNDNDMAVIDAVLTKQGLPHHTGVKQSLLTHPVFRLATAIVTMRAQFCSPDAVMTAIKTGLTDVADGEADLLERYLRCWNITEKWWKNGDWEMNPGGIGAVKTDRDAKTLEKLNGIRKKICALLLDRLDAFDGKHTVKEMAKALYDILCGLEVTNKLDAEGIRVWNLLIDAIDATVEFMGENVIAADGFAELLAIAGSGADTGSIPQKADEISVVSAFKLRSFGIRHSWLFGCVEDSFPMKPSNGGLLSEDDKETLEMNDDSLESKRTGALYDFYTALLSASESVTLTAHSNKADAFPSSCFEEVKAMFGKSSFSNEFDADRNMKFVQDRRSAEEYLGIYRGTPEGDGICEALGKADEDIAMTGLTETLPQDVVSLVEIGGDGNVSISVSAMENYLKCPLMYELKRGLRLKEDGSGDIDASARGTFIHYVFEKYFKNKYPGIKNGGLTGDTLKMKIDAEVNDLAADYLRGVGVEGRLNRQKEQFIEYMKKSTSAILYDMTERLRNSEYQPAEFEKWIGGENSLRIDLDGRNEKIVINGKVDRIDKAPDGSFIIVDYKTNKNTKFDKTKIENDGFGMQMPLYLFSCGKDGVGMLYQPAYLGKTKSDKDVLDRIKEELSPNGIVLTDKKALANLEGLKGVTGADADYLSSLSDTVKAKTKEIVGDGILSGEIKASNEEVDKKSPCEYCKYGSICRMKKEKKW